jgi:hypothetical protein
VPRSPKDAALAEAEAAHALEVAGEKEFRTTFGHLVSDLPSDPEALKKLSEYRRNETANCIFEQGRVFVMLKHTLPHGAFGEHLKEIGVPHDFANRAMKLVADFAKLGEGADYKKFIKFGSYKSQLLISVAAEDPAEFQEHGTIKGHDVDEYDAMGYREMKAALRKKDTEIAKGKEKIGDYKEKNAELHEQIVSLKSHKEDETIACIGRVMQHTKDALTDLENNAKTRKVGKGTLIMLASAKQEARAFSKALCALIDERFPEVPDVEVLSDEDMLPETLEVGSAPAVGKRKKAKIIDAPKS